MMWECVGFETRKTHLTLDETIVSKDGHVGDKIINEK